MIRPRIIPVAALIAAVTGCGGIPVERHDDWCYATWSNWYGAQLPGEQRSDRFQRDYEACLDKHPWLASMRGGDETMLTFRSVESPFTLNGSLAAIAVCERLAGIAS